MMTIKTLTGEESSSSENLKPLDAIEELIISKLISIENRITTIETSMTWFKFIARGSVIVITGFFGFNFVGVI